MIQHIVAIVLKMSTTVLVMRSASASTSDLLSDQTRDRVLSPLFGAPDESFYIRETARQIETSVGTVQRELALLAVTGLVNRVQRGNQVFYQVS